MSNMHAFRVGLVEGADFMGAYVQPKGHSPGFAARKYGIFDYDYTDYPDLDYRLNDRSRLEKTLETTGVIIGVASNICLFFPQIAAYLKREMNKVTHKQVFYRNCVVAMFNGFESRTEQERAFFEKLKLIEQG